MDTTTTTTTKTRIITLTDRPPVTIREDDWPLIAEATWFQGEFERQANRKASVRVREHKDGRRIVYGVTMTQFQGERSRAAGELIPAPPDPQTYPEDTNGAGTFRGDEPATIRAIHAVTEALGYHDHLAQECIADLPAEEI